LRRETSAAKQPNGLRDAMSLQDGLSGEIGRKALLLGPLTVEPPFRR
jgi:hypothetical protein